MVDIEFIVQFLVLGYAHQHPQLIGNLGNIALLNIAGKAGLIDPVLAQSVGDAYRILRSRQHRLRLDGAEKTRIQLDGEPELAQSRELVQKLWLEIFKAPSDL
jgi:glutamate-ammonia-ligase adenylyltransferase